MLDIKLFLTFLLALVVRDFIDWCCKWVVKLSNQDLAQDVAWRQSVGAPLFDKNGEKILDKQEEMMWPWPSNISPKKNSSKKKKKMLHTSKK